MIVAVINWIGNNPELVLGVCCFGIALALLVVSQRKIP